MELLENIDINKYTFKLVEDKQPVYKPIYAVSPVKFKILKTYIKIYFLIRFI